MDVAERSVLIAAGFGDAVSGGGLFAVDGSRAEQIDRISTTGLAFDGRRLARSLRCSAPEGDIGEIIVYDARGVKRYLRVDDMPSIHDLAWDGDDIVVAFSWGNAIRWLSPSGAVSHEIRYRGPRDSWHLNCVTMRDGRWYATAFGDFGVFRGWDGPARKGQGRIVELKTGETVVNGLSSPHSLRWIDGMWVVCNSDEREVLAIDEATGRVVRSVSCGFWTRGIAYDDDFLYVGACMRRATEESFGASQVVVIDRRTWDVVDRILLRAQEVYDLIFVPESIVDGLRRGFDTNPRRTAEARQYAILDELGVRQPRTLWPSGDPLPWDDFTCRVTCDIPATCVSGDVLDVPLTVTNLSNSFFSSAPPAPVFASYKWLDPTTGALVTERRAQRSPLPRTLFPAESLEMTALIAVPEFDGDAMLRITLMQEGVAWFDDRDARNAAEFNVEIRGSVRTVLSSAAPTAG